MRQTTLASSIATLSRPLLCAAAFALLGVGSSACGDKPANAEAKPAPKKLDPCPKRHAAVKDDALECRCEGEAKGVVWGDGIYTSDSSICRAAVHAGALKAGESGDVTVKKAPGCDGYRSSTANGVKAERWGKWTKSFYFEGHGDATCKPPEKAADNGTIGDDLKALKKGVEGKLDAASKAIDKAGKEAAVGMKKAAKELEEDVNKKLGGAGSALKELGTSITKGVTIGGATADNKPANGDCPASFSAAGKDEVTCTCGPGGSSGSVYGAHPFTADSSICTAARALGVIGKDGGKVTVKKAPGCGMYRSLKANGVTTTKWGKYPTSFVFPAKGAVACPTAATSDPCPSSFQAAGRDEVTCACEPSAATGSVYGSHPFTTDSSICAAAKHAGLLKDAKTTVTAKKAAGCSTYVGSEANGVKTTSWGTYPNSFVFPARGAAACPR